MNKNPVEGIAQVIPAQLRNTFLLRAFGLFKVPLILFCSPTVVEMTDDRCVVKIPLNRRTRNHLGSMYFGTLAVGADVAGGFMAWRLIDKLSGGRVSLIFKDFKAEFLKRPEGDVFFTCEEGQAIRELVKKTIDTGERQNLPVHITATVPSLLGTEPVARFVLTLSLKRR